MDVIRLNFYSNNTGIRLFFTGSLIFCFLLGGLSCGGDNSHTLTVEWQNEKAIAVTIPRQLLPAIPLDSMIHKLQVQLAEGKEQPAILGEYKANSEGIIFHPLIPFTPGLKYNVTINGKLLGDFKIPVMNPRQEPAVMEIYPLTDTVPENLLKMYIRFSKPMQEGRSLEHIKLIRNNRDTVDAVFLGLNHELWNNDHTLLTLWLDPGRIKRDLRPNLEMGPPLRRGEHYELIIGEDWQDANGNNLAESIHKKFVVGMRDSISPDPGLWTIQAPGAGTGSSLEILFHEPLDYVLLYSTISIVDSSGIVVRGTAEPDPNGTGYFFTPTGNWNKGKYTIEIEARLEDLAGNNLNRLFDNDLLQQPARKPKDIYTRTFIVK